MSFRSAILTAPRLASAGWCAAALLLAAATFCAWQCRFERVGAPSNASFAEGGAGWEVTGDGVAFEKGNDASTIVRLTRSPGGSVPLVSRQLDAEAQRYVWIRCEFASRDLKPGPEIWQLGRVVCYGIDAGGQRMFNREHGTALAQGTQAWQENEIVFELDPRMKQVRVSLQNFGDRGEYSVRNFDLAYVRDRPALNWVVPLLLLGWASWLVTFMRWGLGSKAAIWRCGLGSALPLILFWLLALPGIGTTARPLAGRSFLGLQIAAAPGRISTADNQDREQTRVGQAAPDRPTGAHTTPSPETATSLSPAAPIPRHQPWFEWVSRKWDLLHGVVFFGLTMALLVLTGARSVWWISAALVVLIQGVEWFEHGVLEIDDAFEILFAAAGIAFALWLWPRCRNGLAAQRSRARCHS